MTDPGMGYPCGADGERHSGQTPEAGRCALCIYCRTDRFVYWPSAIRLSLTECPGCQLQGPRRPGHRTAESPAGRRVQPDHGNDSRAERYLATPASGARFSMGWQAASLTVPFTPAPGRCR
jgi:hypothetical protein